MRYEFSKCLEIARADFSPIYEHRCQVFSFSIYKGRIISIGRNRIKTNPINLVNRLYFRDGVVHLNKGTCAEFNCLNKLKNKTNIPFDKITLINVRLNKSLNPCMSRPCKSCESLIHYVKPREVWFTNELGNFELYI